MSSEERLAQRAAQGDQRAFEEIYERYHQDLYRFCLAMVGNPQDAQDALQNTMVKVLRNLPGEKREIKLKPWLYRIARNESVETLRKRRDTAELEPQQMPVAAVTETAETRERLRTLLADLDQLPERQRAALVMRELSGLDFDQIGAAFETSAAVARQTLYEARLSLRQLEAGREMRCADVMLELSNADGRVTRRRDIRAHLRSCADCRAFGDEIATRHEDLAALAPLPIAASAGLLQGVLGSSAGAAGGGISAIGAGAGKAIAGSALAKSAATAAVVAVVGVSAADRTGIVDLPLPSRGDDAPAKQASEAGAPTAGGAAEPVRPAGLPAAQQNEAASRRDENGKGKSNAQANGKSGAKHASSHSQAGQAPPGGGYGRSAARRKGRPESLPAASAKGQETSAAKKSPQATSPPGHSGAPSQGKSSAGGAPAAKPVSPPKGKPSAATPPAPEPSAQSPKSEAEGIGHGQGAAPSGHEA
ncbi:MAG TPA: sigma-70 family RNA polymerase sigma factor [Solirubrobacterales bacterium]